MDIAIITGIILQTFSVAVSLATIAYLMARGKSTPLVRIFLRCQGLVVIWSAGQIFQLLASDPVIEELFRRIQYFSICFIGLGWLIFCLYYTNSRMTENRAFIRLLFIPPAVFYAMVLTNGYHHLFYNLPGESARIYGPFFWFHTLWSYLYLITGTALLVKHSIKQMGYARKQAWLLVFAVSVPFAANIIFISNRIRPELDITPVTFAVSLTLFSIATFRYRFLNIIPIAFSRIVDNLREAVLVVDAYNRVISLNSSFTMAFADTLQVKVNDDIAVIAEEIGVLAKKGMETERIVRSIKDEIAVNVTGELNFPASPGKSFSVSIQPILSNRKEIMGRIISLNDITEYKSLLQEVKDKNEELVAMNEQLKEYAATVEELAVARERNRFARDVHDTLGHTMTLLIALMEVASITSTNDPGKTGEKLSEATKIAREGLKELRRSISGLAPEKLESVSLLEALQRLVSEFRASGTNVEFSVLGQQEHIKPLCSDVVYRICQEAMTNSLRHGKAKNISIILKTTETIVKLFIFDDGCGAHSIKKGYGLTGMEDRVRSVNGRIVYGSDGESGFNIRVEIPLEGEMRDD